MQTIPQPPHPNAWSFIAMEYYFGILNRTYQVFVTPTLIAGGFVKSMVATPLSLLWRWFDPTIYASRSLMERYTLTSIDSPEFKRLSPIFNFQYRRSSIRHVWYKPTLKWGMGAVAHSGKLYLQLESGRKREFILLGLQQGIDIVRRIENSDNANPADDAEFHHALNLAFNQPTDIGAWVNLMNFFSRRGEQAQEAYCRTYLRMLEHAASIENYSA